MAMSPGAHASGAYRAAAAAKPARRKTGNPGIDAMSDEAVYRASEGLRKMGADHKTVSESIAFLKQHKQSGGDMFKGAIEHVGPSRTEAFRGQLDAIAKATPSAQQDANWQGRGDG